MATRDHLRLQALPNFGPRSGRKRGFALALAAAGTICAPAFSSEETARKQAQAAVEARNVMHGMAICVVQADREEARRFVLMPANESVPADIFRKIADGRCLGFRSGQLRMRGTEYRAALAEQLVRTELASRPVIDPSNIPALEWASPGAPATQDARTGKPLPADLAAVLQRSYDRAVADRLVSRLGECAVRADPVKALALLKTGVDKPEERAVMQAMVPIFAACVKQGETLAFNRNNLRNGIAISYYRLASAAGRTAVAQAGAHP